MRMRKGQSALEYLVTYGWAILALVVVAAILWCFGILKPNEWTQQPSDLVAETILNATPVFTSCNTSAFYLGGSAYALVCRQSNGLVVRVECEKLSGNLYCSSQPLIKLSAVQRGE